MTDNMKVLFTETQAAEYLKIRQATLYALANSGFIRHTTIGVRRLFAPVELEKIIATNIIRVGDRDVLAFNEPILIE